MAATVGAILLAAAWMQTQRHGATSEVPPSPLPAPLSGQRLLESEPCRSSSEDVGRSFRLAHWGERPVWKDENAVDVIRCLGCNRDLHFAFVWGTDGLDEDLRAVIARSLTDVRLVARLRQAAGPEEWFVDLGLRNTGPYPLILPHATAGGFFWPRVGLRVHVRSEARDLELGSGQLRQVPGPSPEEGDSVIAPGDTMWLACITRSDLEVAAERGRAPLAFRFELDTTRLPMPAFGQIPLSNPADDMWVFARRGRCSDLIRASHWFLLERE